MSPSRSALGSWRLSRVVGLCAFVAACGGGDGGPVSRTAPTATITEPAAFAADLNGQIAFSVIASDDAASVEFEVDGVTLAGDTVAPYTTQVNTGAHASGQHVLRARAVDRVGNRSAWSSVTVQFGGSRTQPDGFTRDEAFVVGLSAATAMAQTPDGRLLVAQQGGALRLVSASGLQTAPVLSLAVNSVGERGLLGVAVHPNFPLTPWIYLYYTTTDTPPHNRISRFTVNGDQIAPASEVQLVNLPDLGPTNHNGGALHFGIDGKLYVGVGENANGANAQDLTTPLGKLLRFNDDGSIPIDNPFAGSPIWAYGLRNPFTFAVQPGTGRIHVNDVGEGTWEEIDLVTKGANFGWPASEGPNNVTGNITPPLFAYNHSAATPAGSGPGGFFVGNVIAGGTFYPDAGPFPAPFRGNYFSADSGAKFIGVLDLANGNAAYSFGRVSDNPVDMGVAADGALLVLTRSGITRFSPP